MVAYIYVCVCVVVVAVLPVAFSKFEGIVTSESSSIVKHNSMFFDFCSRVGSVPELSLVLYCAGMGEP